MAELLAFREKMQWLGRQVNAINEKGEEGRKAAEASAKQVAPMFDGPFEKEIIRFFIKDGGNGNGDGDGKDGKDDKGEPSGGGKAKSESGPASGPVFPDGVHEIPDEASFSRLGLPKDSPHRKHYVRNVLLEDDGEAFRYIGSAYGIPFKCHKYGGAFTFAGLK